LVFLAALVAFGVGVESGPAQAESYRQVVDNAGKRFSAPSVWRTSTDGTGINGRDYRYTRPKAVSQAASFKVRRPETGRYVVYARWPKARGLNTAAPIGVRLASGGIRWKNVDQTRNGGRWVRLGAYRMKKGDDAAILVSRWTSGKGRVAADAVRIVHSPLEPKPESSPPPPDSGGVTGNDIVAEARRHLDKQYAYGGTGPNSFDCSGFTQYVYKQFGVSLPRVAEDQYHSGPGRKVSDPRPGDLIFGHARGGSGIQHVGIVTGNGTMIHAGTPETDVEETNYTSWYTVVGYKRIVG
jgi:hypothetical protein